jgi:hypothetical protein
MVYLYGMIELALVVTHQVIYRVGGSTKVVEAGLSATAQVWPYVIANPQISVPLAVGLVLGGLAHSVVDFA